MKKIININLSSRLIPIEDSAYEILRQYLDSLKRYFSKEEGADEIVGDIESRIAEIFQDKIRKGAHCITDEDVHAIKTSMGTPEQFADEPAASTGSHAGQQAGSTASETFNPYIRPRKRFYRDSDHKVLGGVCAGLGAYFNLDPVIFRVLFAIAAIFWGGGILIYIILWFATPEAITAAEKLEMRGERVDLNNIKDKVQEEMNTFRTRMDQMGDDVRNFSGGRGKQFGRDAGTAIEGFFRGLVNVIGYIAKGFFLFLGVAVLFSLVVGLIVAAIFSAVLLPVKDLIFDSGIQTTLFWPALCLMIGLPILALIMFIVRKITGIRQTKYAGYTMGFLWMLGLFLTIWLTVSVTKDFNARVTEKQEMFISQPSNGKLVIKKAEDLIEIDQSIFDGELRVADDTVVIGDVRVDIRESPTDSFTVTLSRSSRGKTKQQAQSLAREIEFQIDQQDSVLYIPSGFSIPRHSIYRNQEVGVTIYVPKGKHIKMDREVRRYIHTWRNRWFDDHNYDWDENDQLDIRMDNRRPEEQLKEREKVNSRDSVYKHYEYKGPGSTQPAPATPEKTDTVQKVSAMRTQRSAKGLNSFLFSGTFRNA